MWCTFHVDPHNPANKQTEVDENITSLAEVLSSKSFTDNFDWTAITGAVKTDNSHYNKIHKTNWKVLLTTNIKQ